MYMKALRFPHPCPTELTLPDLFKILSKSGVTLTKLLKDEHEISIAASGNYLAGFALSSKCKFTDTKMSGIFRSFWNFAPLSISDQISIKPRPKWIADFFKLLFAIGVVV